MLNFLKRLAQATVTELLYRRWENNDCDDENSCNYDNLVFVVGNNDFQ